MAKITQEKAVKGSQKWFQVLVNQYREVIDGLLRPPLQLKATDAVTWLSPLAGDNFAEYRDEDFLERVSVRLENRGLESFWPRGGPVWDGLAQTSRGDVIIVEAKSHVSEMVSSCQAGRDSWKLINGSLAEAAAYYHADHPNNWTDRYYQYANRLAHLFFLRHVNNIPVWLVFVYFVYDSGMGGPSSEDEWRQAIADIHKHLGCKTESPIPYVVDLFVDVEQLGMSTE